MSTGAWRRVSEGKDSPSGIPVLLGQPSSSPQCGPHSKGLTMKHFSDGPKKDTDHWGEENRGFQDETASPLPDLLIDLHGLGCTYNVGQDRVTLLHNEVVEERKEGHMISK